MQRFLKHIGVFCLLFIPAYFAGTYVVGRFAPESLRKNIKFYPDAYGQMQLRKLDADTTTSVDVLVLGSSHAYRGFDPRIFEEHGLKLFNLGSSGQTPLQSEFLLKHYAPKLQPKLVLIEVYPKTFQTTGIGPFIDLTSNFQVTSGIYKQALHINHVEAWNGLFFAQIHDWFGTRPAPTQVIHRRNDTYIKGGFVEKDYRALDSFEQYNEPETLQVDVANWEALERCVEFCKEQGIHISLVQSPINPHRFQNFVGTTVLDSAFQALKPNQYLNSNQHDLQPKPQYFYDSHHLTQEGVIWFNQWLLDQLKKPTH